MISKKYTIFIVDDDKFLLDMYATKFSQHGFEVFSFLSGQDALAALREKKNIPDVITLDLVMPEMSGYDLIETIKKEKLAPDARVIVFSNQGESSDIEKAEQMGADGYIIKAGCTPSEAITRVHEIVEKKKN